MGQRILITNSPADALQELLAAHNACNVFILADTNTARIAVPRLMAGCPALSGAETIVVSPGDENKNLTALSSVWEALTAGGATRHSVLVNVGGGMVTDLGGFAAATFKRGIGFINVPTTLLGAVDAAVGGKTGINFAGLKNEVGVFRQAEAVVLSSVFFDTLPESEFMSGYAEVIKHALIDSSESLSRVLDRDSSGRAGGAMLNLLAESVEVKRRIVAEDPCETGLRKALNLGHTAGHAFEAIAMERNAPVPHGYAVAWGLVVDMVLSHIRLGFPSAVLRQVADYVCRHYPAPALRCADYPHLLELMRHDKKNRDARHINFTLLKAPGEVLTDIDVPEEDICAALDIFRDLMHI